MSELDQTILRESCFGWRYAECINNDTSSCIESIVAGVSCLRVLGGLRAIKNSSSGIGMGFLRILSYEGNVCNHDCKFTDGTDLRVRPISSNAALLIVLHQEWALIRTSWVFNVFM